MNEKSKFSDVKARTSADLHDAVRDKVLKEQRIRKLQRELQQLLARARREMGVSEKNVESKAARHGFWMKLTALTHSGREAPHSPSEATEKIQRELSLLEELEVTRKYRDAESLYKPEEIFGKKARSFRRQEATRAVDTHIRSAKTRIARQSLEAILDTRHAINDKSVNLQKLFHIVEDYMEDPDPASGKKPAPVSILPHKFVKPNDKTHNEKAAEKLLSLAQDKTAARLFYHEHDLPSLRKRFDDINAQIKTMIFQKPGRSR
jgi:hypothetical protein